jgi:hypothetical protein
VSLRSAAVPERPDGSPLPAELAWLAGALWPGADVRLGRDGVPAGFRTAESYEVVPSPAHPRLLVPTWDPSLVGVALDRFDDAMSIWARVRRALAARAAGLGSDRFRELVVSLPRDPHPDELVTHVLRDVFGRPDLVAAFSFGPARPNRKPVAQALLPDGEVLGFAKIGWNTSTDALVAHEASVLRRWRLREPRSFTVPRLIGERRLRSGRVMTVVDPLPTAFRAERRGVKVPPLDATREIATSGGVGVAPLSETPFWRRLVERAGARASRPRRAASLALAWIEDVHGRRPIWHGSWHGDWAPQNMSTVGGRLHVWDWERAGDGAPLGLDLLHYLFQVEFRRRGDVRRAADVAFHRAAPPLRALGVPDDDHALLMVCYLAELLLRYEEGRDAGSTVRPGVRDDVVDSLRRWVGRS